MGFDEVDEDVVYDGGEFVFEGVVGVLCDGCYDLIFDVVCYVVLQCSEFIFVCLFFVLDISYIICE